MNKLWLTQRPLTLAFSHQLSLSAAHRHTDREKDKNCLLLSHRRDCCCAEANDCSRLSFFRVILTLHCFSFKPSPPQLALSPPPPLSLLLLYTNALVSSFFNTPTSPHCAPFYFFSPSSARIYVQHSLRTATVYPPVPSLTRAFNKRKPRQDDCDDDEDGQAHFNASL